MRFFFICVVALLGLSACTGPLDTGPGPDVLAARFAEAMRWQDFVGASAFVQADVRDEFRQQFTRDDDLKIVESRVERIKLAPETKLVEVDYRMQYYRLPSMRVKKWQWNQQWQLQQEKAMMSGVWLITNAPPEGP